MGKEIILNDSSFLVSETDEEGMIRFANDEFCEIAGYRVDELIGMNHNIVRDEDMPKIAFKTMWETIQRGETWDGYVKNKTKNGDYYWVYATVYPFENSDSNKGYLSCRRKATQEEIAEHEVLYKKLLQEEKS